jgi:mannosyltransferase OCH1-like enzyme
MQTLKLFIKTLYFDYLNRIFKTEPLYKTYSLNQFNIIKKKKNFKKIVVHMIWLTGKLTQIEIMCINSFIKNGFKVNLWTNKKIYNLPKNIKVTNINKVDNIKKYPVYKSGPHYMLETDVLRIKILHKYGGLYADTDMICNISEKEFSELFDSPFLCSENHHKERSGLSINNNLMYFPKPNDRFLNFVDNLYQNYALVKKIPWAMFGGKFFSILANNLKNFTPIIMKPIFANPIPYWKSPDIFLHSVIKLTDQTAFVHLYNERWRITKVNKNSNFKRGSTIDLMLKKYPNK